MIAPIHIYPINDLKEHFLSSLCECEPTIKRVEGDQVLIIHNSFDGREGVELANEVLNKTNKQ